MRVRSIFFATGLALAACSDGGTEPPPPCAEEPGHACVWLGQTGNEGYNGEGLHRLETAIYWSMDMLFTQSGDTWFIDWNNHLLRRVQDDGSIRTVVGWNDPIFPGDGTGDASEKTPEGADGSLVKLNHPTELVEGADGKILMMAWHNHKLREIDPATGNVRILGGGGAGFAGDGGPVAMALFRQPKALVRDAEGNLYISDQGNLRVRKVDTAGIVTTIAGNGMQGFGGDGGPATDAMLNWETGSNPEPSGGLAVGGGKLYIADTLNHRIRVLDLATGMITTLAGTGEEGYAGDGGPASAAKFAAPRELELGPDGHLYVADTDNNVIRAIDLASGTVRTVAGTGELGVDEVDGLLATETKLRRPFGLEFDPAGNMYVMDTINSRILKVAK